MTVWVAPKEVEALQMSAQGLSDKQIARRLGVPIGTVNARCWRGQTKLGAKSRVHAVALLIAAMAIDPPKPIEVKVGLVGRRPLTDFAEDYKILEARGMTRPDIAKTFGIKPSSVERAVWRARRAGLLPPVVTS